MALFAVWVVFALASRTWAINSLVDLGYSKYLGTSQSNGITSWLGIRFAAPPLGDLRFRAPRPPLYNSTVQPANTFGPLCLPTQPATLYAPISEDCLFLDVFAPSNATAESKLPVFFWIQGGGFNRLSNGNYRGDGLIQASGDNIVVVTINYRVSLYGFLASEEVVANGNVNVGMLDQRFALEWVQKYIAQARFGGDPGHVTIGGCSAGGASVTFHLTAYGGRDDGLFHAAAAESASAFAMLTVEQSQYQYDALIARVGCNTTTDTLQCLRGISADELQAQNIGIPFPGLGPNASAPLFMYDVVIDGDMVQDSSQRQFAQGKFIKVPVIYGDDTNGGTQFAPNTTASYAQMDQFLLDNYPTMTTDQIATFNYIYQPAQTFPNTGAFWRTAANAYGEMAYLCPSMYVSTAFATYSTQGSWNYRYNVEDPTQMANGMGVPHTVETASIWGPQYVAGTAPPPASYSPNGTNAGIIPFMQGYWSSFIRSYSPNTYRVFGSPVWQEWVTTSQDRLMIETNATAMETVDIQEQSRCAYMTANTLMWLQSTWRMDAVGPSDSQIFSLCTLNRNKYISVRTR
ncbi:putative triacylglycerol lipase [Calocera cornea HHB12733]|uniref:Carboxylic ester hydrolase n=1 Tax=Calocera cornea HHB12733 TaxID=1353952 RepID=A0A165END6_9BASI|nr:putative triacylglycerol lipase [Calocera cornea HHB12733]